MAGVIKVKNQRANLPKPPMCTSIAQDVRELKVLILLMQILKPDTVCRQLRLELRICHQIMLSFLDLDCSEMNNKPNCPQLVQMAIRVPYRRTNIKIKDKDLLLKRLYKSCL